MPGDGLCGGPACGILVGRRQEVERIKESAAWPALAASHETQAMILVTLETATAGSEQVPVLAQLNTSQENLQSRAERMAIRLEGSDAVANCRVTTEAARLTESASSGGNSKLLTRPNLWSPASRNMAK